MSKVVTRFPPSPTGHLHIGGARTALFNWLLARNSGGKFILRIEDTDLERSSEEMTKAIIEAMEWLGLTWDEGPYFQTKRLEIYQHHIDMLIDQGKAYYCQCTKEEVEEMRKRAMERGEKPKYSGKCRELNLGPGPGRVVRFKTPLEGETTFNDLLKGPISVNNKELDDFVIRREDGTPTYNLAVVVDDATMGVTHILRGDDHINNTPKQVLLYEALGYNVPYFIHVPMILGPDKKKLSKRHGAKSVLEYRELGYLPEAVLNYLVRLGWSYKDQEIFTVDELIKKFSIKNLSNSASVFDPEKLKWVNSQHIKRKSPKDLAILLRKYLAKQGINCDDLDYLEKIVPLLQPRSTTMVEMAEKATFFVLKDEEINYSKDLLNKFLTPEVRTHLEEILKRLKQIEVFDQKHLEDLMREYLNEKNIKFKLVAQPIRVCITGRTASPGLFETMEVLGKERTINRLSRALKI